MGYVGWIGKYDTKNSVLVDQLLKAGAVFYVKTSVPQSLMTCETVNNIIGRTVNPRTLQAPPFYFDIILINWKVTRIGHAEGLPAARGT